MTCTNFECLTFVDLIEAICFLLSPSSRKVATFVQKSLLQPQASQLYMSHALCRKKITGGTNGGLINDATLKSLDVRKDFLFPLSLLFHNTRPVGRQVLEMCTTCKWIIFIFIYWLIHHVSGHPAAADLYHSSGRHFCYPPLIAPVILDISCDISCYSARSSFIIAFPISCWLKCLVK